MAIQPLFSVLNGIQLEQSRFHSNIAYGIGRRYYCYCACCRSNQATYASLGAAYVARLALGLEQIQSYGQLIALCVKFPQVGFH